MSRQLATEIARFSVWQHLYGMAFLLITLVLLFTFSLSWQLEWQLSRELSWIWVVAISILCVIIYALALLRMRHQPLHITLCDVNASRGEWQLLYAGYEKPVLWQAQMLAIESLRHCVFLTFQTQYPSACKKTVVIWQDQVSANIWRRLKVLSC